MMSDRIMMYDGRWIRIGRLQAVELTVLKIKTSDVLQQRNTFL